MVSPSPSPARKSTSEKKPWIALAVAGGALIVALIAVTRTGERPKPKEVVQPDTNNAGSGDGKPVKDGYVRVGGVDRPKSDLKSTLPSVADEDSNAPDYGETQPIDPNSNPHTRSVAEAFKTGKYPERLSNTILPKAFNAQAYAADPEAYLNVVEPGRVFQPAQPGPDVSRIEYVSKYRERIQQGDKVPLRVKVPPGSPVTFTSFDLGEFQNLLTSITVRANADGVATAVFRGSPGTIGNADILVASPVTSGQLKFAVSVVLPKPAG